jgi:hypothetical protein
VAVHARPELLLNAVRRNTPHLREESDGAWHGAPQTQRQHDCRAQNVSWVCSDTKATCKPAHAPSSAASLGYLALGMTLVFFMTSYRYGGSSKTVSVDTTDALA